MDIHANLSTDSLAGRLSQRLKETGAPDDVRALADALTELAVRDPLTNLFNRRIFDEALARSIETAQRLGSELSLVIFDINKLKQLNDTQGHIAGDEAIQKFTAVLRQTARETDIICRLGGDEFAVILPDTAKTGAREFVRRFTENLEPVTSITAGVGIASLPSENILAAADQELLKAKTKQ